MKLNKIKKVLVCSLAMIGIATAELTSNNTKVQATNWKKVARETENTSSKVTVPKNTKFVVYTDKKKSKDPFSHKIWNIFWWPAEWDEKSKYMYISEQGTRTSYDYYPCLRPLTKYAGATDGVYCSWHGVILVAENTQKSILSKLPEGLHGDEAPYCVVYYYENDSAGYRLGIQRGWLPKSVLKKQYVRGKGTFDLSKFEDGTTSPWAHGAPNAIVRGTKVIKGYTTLRHLEWNARKCIEDDGLIDSFNPYTGPIKTKKQRHSAEEKILKDIEDNEFSNNPQETITRAIQGLKRLEYSDSMIQNILDYQKNNPNPRDYKKYLANIKSFYLD